MIEILSCSLVIFCFTELNPEKEQVTSPVSVTQSSNTTVTTTGSLQSIPSSISQASPVREPVLSPSGSSGRHSVSEKIASGPSGKRLSIEQVV